MQAPSSYSLLIHNSKTIKQKAGKNNTRQMLREIKYKVQYEKKFINILCLCHLCTWGPVAGRKK
jgi:hypothetical protein